MNLSLGEKEVIRRPAGLEILQKMESAKFLKT
jgi:hypothetical protein